MFDRAEPGLQNMFLQKNSIGQPQPPSRTYISTPFSDYLPYYENLHKLQTSYRTNVLTKFFSVVANFLINGIFWDDRIEVLISHLFFAHFGPWVSKSRDNLATEGPKIPPKSSQNGPKKAKIWLEK